MRNSQVGDLLVASTIVEGTVLSQSVCLLVHEDEDNAIGLLLNRPLQTVGVVGNHANPTKVAHPTEAAHPTKAIENPSESQVDPTSPAPQPSSTNRLLPHWQTPPHSNATIPHDTPHTGMKGQEATQGGPQHSGPQHGGPQQPTIVVVGPDGDPAAGQMLHGKSLHFGGPLSGPVVAVHGSAELAEAEAGEGIFVAAQRDHLEALLRADSTTPYRLIIGHLGWTQEQLNHEISSGVWHRMPATADLKADILSTHDGLLWSALVRRATSHSLSRWLGTEHIAPPYELN